MKRLIASTLLPAALLPLATPARACPPVAPAQAFGVGMGYGAPVAVAPAMGSYGINVGLGAAYAPPAVAGFGAAPLYGSSGLGVGLGGYGVSSVGAYGAAPVGGLGLVQNRALIVNGRPGLFQRRLIRRHLRRGF